MSCPWIFSIRRPNVPADTEWYVQLAAREIRLNKWLEIARQSELPVTDSSGSADVRIELLGTKPYKVEVANLDLTALTLAQPADEPIVIDRLEGDLQWRRNGRGMERSRKRGASATRISELAREYLCA